MPTPLQVEKCIDQKWVENKYVEVLQYDYFVCQKQNTTVNFSQYSYLTRTHNH